MLGGEFLKLKNYVHNIVGKAFAFSPYVFVLYLGHTGLIVHPVVLAFFLSNSRFGVKPTRKITRKANRARGLRMIR